MIVLFVNTEMWQVFSDVSDPALAGVVALFIAVGSGFVVARLPREVRELEREVGADPPLTTRQRFNVGLVMFVSQGAAGARRARCSSARSSSPSARSRSRPTSSSLDRCSGRIAIAGHASLSVELLKVSSALAAFSGLYYAIAVLTDAAYREEFLEELQTSLHETFHDRAGYLDGTSRGRAVVGCAAPCPATTAAVLPPARPASGRAAARADRRAHAARRSRGELLVRAPPRRLRVDRRPGRRTARRRHGLRRGLRLRRAGARRRGGGRRRRRQPRGLRARAAALRARQPALRAHDGGDVSTSRATRSSSCRRSSTCRTRARCSRASASSSGAAGSCSSRRRTCSRWRRRAPSARATRGTSTSTARRSSRRCARRTSARSSCTACSMPRKLALHAAALKLGWDAVHARLGTHEALLRPVRARDRCARLRAAPRARRASCDGALDFVAVLRA